MGIAEDLATLEQQLRELRIQYERYFAGLEKLEPVKLREQIARALRQYSTNRTAATKTGLSFRLNSLTATFNAYSSYWNRVVRQIEEGTYSRDRFRQKLKEHKGGEASPAPERREPAAEAQAAAARFREGPEPEDRALRGLYEAYVAARRRTGEPVDDLQPEKLARAIRQQLPQITKRFNCRSVEFRVVVEDGRTKLKAIPR